MNLTRKTLFLLMTIALLSFGAAVTQQQRVTIPAFKNLEARGDRKDVERVLTGFDALRNNLYTMAYDYANWDDTYQHFLNKDQQYVESNYVIDTFISNSVDLIAFANREGQFFWYELANLKDETFYPQDFYNPAELAGQLPDLQKASTLAPLSRSGIVRTSLGPMIISAHSVHQSNSLGDSPGSLLMGRLISDDTIQEVQQLVKVSFTTTIIDKEKPSAFQYRQLKFQYRDSNNIFYWYIEDINGQPMIKLSIDVGESVVAQYKVNNTAVFALVLTTLSCLVIVGYLNWSVVKPVLAIKKYLQQIRISGNYYYRLASIRKDEIGDLSNECDALIDQIEKQNRILAKQSAELRKLSLEDGLTGLSNRRHFDQLLNDYWSIHEREQQPLSLIMFDIDYFKRFNDHYGHQQGDKVLEQVGLAVTQTLVRKSDKAARYGGEEFVLLLPDTDPIGVVEVAKHLQKEIAKLAIPHHYSSISDHLTVSIGCTTLTPDSKNSTAELIRQADIALYRAKALGRNQITIYNADSE